MENFGKLHQKDLDFSAGLNTISAGNGAGKSTLASFICVMFYGFDGERLHDDIRNERHRFSPWQDGVYGGSLTFSLDGKNWRIERTFGTKNGRTDTLAVYDADTSLRTERFGETPGEIIFSVDRPSFEKTVFTGQLDCVTAATPGISAKIGHVSEDASDMGHYAEAQRWLKAETDRLTPHRKTGRVARMDAEIASLAADAADKTACEDALDRTGDELRRLRKKAEALSAEQEKTADAMESFSASADRKAVLLQDETLRTAEREAAGRVRSAMEKYPAGLPEKEETEKYLRLASGAAEQGRGQVSPLTSAEEERFQREEKFFASGVPTVEETDEMISCWEDCSRRKNETARLKERADGISRLLSETSERQEEEWGAGRYSRAEKSSGGRKGIPVILTGLVLLAAALFTGIPGRLPDAAAAPGTGIAAGGLRIIFTVAGVLLLLAGIFHAAGRKSAGDHQAPGKGEITDSAGDAGEEYRQLIREIRREESRITEEEQTVSDFFSHMNIRVPEDEVTGELYRIREKALDYLRLSGRRQKAMELAQGSAAEISSFLLSAGVTPGDDPESQLLQLMEDRKQLDMLTALWQTGRETREKFEKAHPEIFSGEGPSGKSVSGPVENSAGPSMEALSARFRSLKNDAESVQDQIYACEKRAENESAALEHILDSEDTLRKLREERSRAMHRYEMLMKTAELLKKARIRFSSRYMEPLKQSFDRYYEMFAPDDDKIYEMDADLNISVRESGMLRNTAFLSEGYQDMIGLCRRMAMADAMYPGEKPFLVMDDPFVSLDDRKYRGAIRFLEEVSSEYQILYFTCRNRV